MMVSTCCGNCIQEDGWLQKHVIKPAINKEMGFMKGSYIVSMVTISSGWTGKGNKLL